MVAPVAVVRLESGRLRRVPGAPEFPHPAYAVYSEGADEAVVTRALRGLRHVAGRGAGVADPSAA